MDGSFLRHELPPEISERIDWPHLSLRVRQPGQEAQKVIDMALQLHGGLGVKVGTKVESLYRDIRALRIYEGATEVQQLIIGKAVLQS